MGRNTGMHRSRFHRASYTGIINITTGTGIIRITTGIIIHSMNGETLAGSNFLRYLIRRMTTSSDHSSSMDGGRALCGCGSSGTGIVRHTTAIPGSTVIIRCYGAGRHGTLRTLYQ